MDYRAKYGALNWITELGEYVQYSRYCSSVQIISSTLEVFPVYIHASTFQLQLIFSTQFSLNYTRLSYVIAAYERGR